MTGPDPSERRGAPRIDEQALVKFKDIGGGEGRKTVAAKTLNMSESGLCLLSPEALDPDANLALELSLEGHDSAVMAVGRVVWCDPDGEDYRVGICFTWLRDEDRDALQGIAEYVADRTGP